MQALLFAMAMAVALPAASPTASVGLTIKDVENAVWAQNPGLQAARYDADKRWSEASAEGAWEDPQVSVEWMQVRWPDPLLSEAGTRRYEIVQSVPLFGQAWAMGRTATHAAERADAKTRVEAARLIYEAKLAYWHAQQAGQMVKAEARTQEALATMHKVSAQRGHFGRLDRMGQLMDAMIERELGGDEAMGLHWQAEERSALFELERLMGRDSGTTEATSTLAEVQVVALLAPLWTADELWQKSQRQSPELQEAQHHIIHADAALTQARLDWLPELMLEGGVEEGQDMRDATFKAGINVPWLWFWKASSRNSAAHDELLAARAMAEETRQMLRAQCRFLASELYSSQAELKLSVERILPAAEKALNAATVGYSSGDLDPRESMDAVMGYFKAEEDYAHRLWHVGTTLAAIDRLMAAPAMEMSHE